jgi:uncharacterized protein (TIGR04255 family)
MATKRTEKKRKLANAPLILALAEVKFAPVLAMSNSIPEIQETLRRSGFPGFVSSILHQIQVGAAEGPSFQAAPRWVFSSEDGQQFFTLGTDSLSVQVLNYDDFETFVDTLRVGLVAVANIVQPSYAGRVGLRYVDAVPDVGSDLSGFFNESVLSFTADELGVESLLTSQQVLAKTLHGHLLIRMNQVQDAPLMPAELATPELASLSAPKPGIHAVLDIDSSDDRRGPFSFEDLEQRLWGVHKPASAAFWKAVTAHAIDTWGEETGDDND